MGAEGRGTFEYLAHQATGEVIVWTGHGRPLCLCGEKLQDLMTYGGTFGNRHCTPARLCSGGLWRKPDLGQNTPVRQPKSRKVESLGYPNLSPPPRI
ncbi:uncharacterized protein sS8_3475 [Methylocaldum marinum]|uniref:Uncharacterized protein n=1 Tax=Methylocaldum marinum TaxID=1432792 RepID=A0A250KV00_9GAMM|nr:uncharacterized protein sS8_3475 [Methylocaldum marinum]